MPDTLVASSSPPSQTQPALSSSSSSYKQNCDHSDSIFIDPLSHTHTLNNYIPLQPVPGSEGGRFSPGDSRDETLAPLEYHRRQLVTGQSYRLSISRTSPEEKRREGSVVMEYIPCVCRDDYFNSPNRHTMHSPGSL